MKRQLFAPLRLRFWSRLAMISLVTGEFASGGGGYGGHISAPTPSHRRGAVVATLLDPVWPRIMEFLPWILAGVALLVAFMVAWLYIASVYRFILFEAVLDDRCDLREGWRHWQRQGSSYFLWNIGLALSIPTLLAIVIGGPILWAWRAGLFRDARDHLALLILGGAVLVLLFLGVLLAGAVVALFAKDFAVPVMALEDVGILDAWRRLLPLLAAEKLAYAAYVGMKIVLGVGSAILFGIVYLLTIVTALIPLGILGLVLYILARLAGLTWSFGVISGVVILAGLAIMGLLYVLAFIYNPGLVFFQAYPLYFFGGRYPALADRLSRSPVSPASVAAATPAAPALPPSPIG
jgi:hypothetical protein